MGPRVLCNVCYSILCLQSFMARNFTAVFITIVGHGAIYNAAISNYMEAILQHFPQRAQVFLP